MVVVAQLVEPRIVIPVVVGSNPIDHPNLLAVPHPSKKSIFSTDLLFIVFFGHLSPIFGKYLYFFVLL